MKQAKTTGRIKPRNRRPVIQPKNYCKRLPRMGCAFHRMFFSWYVDNRHLFPEELRINYRTRNRVEFTFPGINAAIQGTINTYEIECHAVRDGEHMDIIAEFPCFISRVPGGYTDELLLPEYKFIAPDKATLCREVSFERFLTWVNKELFTADWMEIEYAPSFYSWAHLRKGENPAFHWNTEPGVLVQPLDGGASFVHREELSRYGELRDVMIWSVPVRVDPAERRYQRYAVSGFD